ncbi:hypothetical protein BJY04DRAFT_170143 [Aspergillus karnatakaensis]|uniref:class I SAM-dependent methyltransferase n=1 Tax=Aspergillus karnatakaensis TaxID=1810916 RepID=UPI003CCD293D
MADGQQSAHGAKYAYTNRYWPEFYDLWVKQLFGSDLEKYDAFYWNMVLPFLQDKKLSSTEATEPLRIVDVGTGTGRVIRGILNRFKEYDHPPRVQILGVDHSQEMLNRAEQLLSSEVQSPLELGWLKTSAASLVDENPDLRNAVDLLVFAAGSIGHLTAAGEREQFLRQVAEALRKTQGSAPARSVAAISILEETEVEDETSDDGVQFGEEMRLRSLKWPELEYRKSATATTRDKSKGVMVEDFSLKVVDISTEAVVHAQDYSWSLKLFNQNEWEGEVSRSGLRTVEKVEQGVEIWYLLQLID